MYATPQFLSLWKGQKNFWHVQIEKKRKWIYVNYQSNGNIMHVPLNLRIYFFEESIFIEWKFIYYFEINTNTGILIIIDRLIEKAPSQLIYSIIYNKCLHSVHN